VCFSTLFGVHPWSPYCLALLPASKIRLTEARKQFNKNTTLTLNNILKENIQNGHENSELLDLAVYQSKEMYNRWLCI